MKALSLNQLAAARLRNQCVSRGRNSDPAAGSRTIADEAESDDGKEELHAAQRKQYVDHFDRSTVKNAMMAIGS